MTDDLLTQFRSGAALPDEATARRIYARATAGRGRVVRRRLALAIAIAAVALIPTGIAFGGRIADFFEGTPPPPPVSTSFTTLNRMADAAVRQGFSSKFDTHVDVSKVHGVIEVQTPDGPEDMWAAPDDQGGQSYLVDFANDPPGIDGVMTSFSGTDDPGGDRPIEFGSVWIYAHPDIVTLYGSVDVDAATVKISFDDGSTATLPVVEHLFLGSAAKGMKADSVTAFDAAGTQLATTSLRPSGS
jgi:hypothetical protein